jgi:hypothetical protein
LPRGCSIFPAAGAERSSMIAAVALGANASLATTPEDFRRLEPAGLQIITT